MSLLTGPEIEILVDESRITIDPFIRSHCGPNSVDLRLAHDLRIYTLEQGFLDADIDNPTKSVELEEDGTYLLLPGQLYLGRTIERIGSDYYVPIVEGRSSLGRLGCQVHMTAGVGDLGFHGTITLEIAVMHPLRIKPGTRICQALWQTIIGTPRLYKGWYQGQFDATASRAHLEGYLPSGIHSEPDGHK